MKKRKLPKEKLEWIIEVLREEFLSHNPLGEDKPKVKLRQPRSRKQAILKEIFERLKKITKGESFDIFDKFGEEYLSNYNSYHIWDLVQFIKGFVETINLHTKFDFDSGYCTPEEVEQLLKEVGQKVAEEPHTLETLEKIINEKYPNLVSLEEEIVAEQIEQQWREYAENLLEKVREVLENGVEVELDEETKKIIKKIEKTEKFQVEDLAEQLNRIIVIGKDYWELILYSMLSPYAPPIYINGVEQRRNINTLIIGDISTAKTSILKILYRISPKAEQIDVTTEANLVGVATKEGIQEGLLDKANEGILLVHEFDKVEEKFPLIRRILDSDYLKIMKYGYEKTLKVNMTLIAGANPRYDFFRHGEVLRDQITMKDGLLSRFDAIIPLTLTEKKNEIIVESMKLFDTKTSLTFEEIQETVKTLALGMKTIKGVIITTEQEKRLKEVFLRYNLDLKYRPLVIPRDLEVLARLVNVVATANFHRRKQKNGYIKASDKDIDKAIQLFEVIVSVRRQLYESTRRNILTPKEQILKIIIENQPISAKTLKEMVVDQLKLCAKSTFYKYLDELIKEGLIKKQGQRNMTLSSN